MLAVAKLNFRDIMGWLLMVFFVYFVITSVAFLFFLPTGRTNGLPFPSLWKTGGKGGALRLDS